MCHAPASQRALNEWDGVFNQAHHQQAHHQRQRITMHKKYKNTRQARLLTLALVTLLMGASARAASVWLWFY